MRAHEGKIAAYSGLCRETTCKVWQSRAALFLSHRFGDCTLPMDDALATAAVDLSGRPFLVWDAEVPVETLGTFSSQLAEEFWRAASSAGQVVRLGSILAMRWVP